MTKETAPAAINLDDFLLEDTAEIEIIAPGGKATGWFIRVAGNSHPNVIAYHDDIQRKELKKSAERERAVANGKKYTPIEDTLEDSRASGIAYLKARVLGWNTVSLGGKELEFSDDGIREIALNPKLAWVGKQIIDSFNDEALFTKRSAKP